LCFAVRKGEIAGGRLAILSGNKESRKGFSFPDGRGKSRIGNHDSFQEIRKVGRNSLFPEGNGFFFRELSKPKRNTLFPPGILKTRWEFAIPARFLRKSSN
jgi:hypothetical protein